MARARRNVNNLVIGARLEDNVLRTELSQLRREFNRLQSGSNRSITQTRRNFRGLRNEMQLSQRAATSLRNTILGLASIAGLIRLGRSIRDLASDVIDLDDRAKSLGLTIQELQTLEILGRDAGASAENVFDSVRAIVTQLQRAREEGGDLADELNRVGFRFQDTAFGNIEELRRILPLLQQTFISRLFQESGTQVVEAFRQAQDLFIEQSQRNQRGQLFDQETVDRAQESIRAWRDAWDRLRPLLLDLSSELAPLVGIVAEFGTVIVRVSRRLLGLTQESETAQATLDLNADRITQAISGLETAIVSEFRQPTIPEINRLSDDQLLALTARLVERGEVRRIVQREDRGILNEIASEIGGRIEEFLANRGLTPEERSEVRIAERAFLEAFPLDELQSYSTGLLTAGQRLEIVTSIFERLGDRLERVATETPEETTPRRTVTPSTALSPQQRRAIDEAIASAVPDAIEDQYSEFLRTRENERFRALVEGARRIAEAEEQFMRERLIREQDDQNERLRILSEGEFRRLSLSGDIQSSLNQFFDDILDDTDNFGEDLRSLFLNVLNDIRRSILDEFVTQPLADLFAGFLRGLIPGRQFGGRVQSGSPYIVGESGRELFIPDRGGRIIPNNRIGGGQPIVVNQNYSFNISTPDDYRAVALQMAPVFSQIAKREIEQAVARGEVLG